MGKLRWLGLLYCAAQRISALWLSCLPVVELVQLEVVVVQLELIFVVVVVEFQQVVRARRSPRQVLLAARPARALPLG